MPSFISYRGKLYPAKEKVALVNKGDRPIHYNGQVIEPGDPFIYEGPDREAIKELMLAGQEFLGQDFKDDPDFLQMVRTRGFNTVDEYLKAFGYDEAEDEKNFKEKASVINRHELPRRHAEIIAMGGGKDTSGNRQDSIGGFGDQRVRSVDEVKKQTVNHSVNNEPDLATVSSGHQGMSVNVDNKKEGQFKKMR